MLKREVLPARLRAWVTVAIVVVSYFATVIGGALFVLWLTDPLPHTAAPTTPQPPPIYDTYIGDDMLSRTTLFGDLEIKGTLILNGRPMR